MESILSKKKVMIFRGRMKETSGKRFVFLSVKEWIQEKWILTDTEKRILLILCMSFFLGIMLSIGSAIYNHRTRKQAKIEVSYQDVK